MRKEKYISTLVAARDLNPIGFKIQHLQSLKAIANGHPNYSIQGLIRKTVILFAHDCGLPLNQNTQLLAQGWTTC